MRQSNLQRETSNRRFKVCDATCYLSIACLLFRIVYSNCPYHSVSFVGRNGMVKFFQTWCGHCTRMAPDWDKLSKEVHPSVFIYDVNCGDEADLCQENGVSGYPTIKYYQNGVEHKYEGGRGFNDLLDFTKENLEQACDVDKLKETCNERAQGYAEKVCSANSSRNLWERLGNPL